jgi:hypothetical protein
MAQVLESSFLGSLFQRSMMRNASFSLDELG